jgi:hypothetical protein
MPERADRRDVWAFGTLAGLAVVLLILMAALSCAPAVTTFQGQPLDPESFEKRTHDHIYNVESGLVTAGEILLLARQEGHVDDPTWAKVKTASARADATITEAKAALERYILTKDAPHRSAVSDSLAVMDAAARIVNAASRDDWAPLAEWEE